MTGIDLDIARLHKSYADGLAPADVIADVYRRIAAADDPGIFITLVDEAAAQAAVAALPPFDPGALPLWGVPFAVKDNIDVFALETTAACPAYAYVAKESAAVVQRLLEAGAILIGKTNLDQFATGLVGVRTPYPVPKNACDPALVPGGSSSGSGVAVARGLVTFALGTDTAGSGRVPAALNNIVGLKPSRGAVSVRGVVPACKTLDCVSIFAATTDDAWRVMQVAAVRDPADPWSRSFSLGAPVAPPAVRFGIPDRAGRIFGSAEAEAAYDAALALLPGRPLAVDLAPFFAAAALLYEGAWVAERYAAIRDFIEARPGALHPVTRAIIEGATRLSAADAFDGIYRLAELASATGDLWRAIDVLVVPSIPDICTLDDVARDPIGANSRLGTYTNFVNLLDLAALAVPGPLRSDGRPAGVTLIAPAGRDALLAAVAETLHAKAGVPLGATGKPLPPPPVRVAAAPAGTVGLAVVGAHLSGMALNHELTERGATFVKAVETLPAYRLYALPDGPPARPGMVRVAEGGAANFGRGVGVDAGSLRRFHRRRSGAARHRHHRPCRRHQREGLPVRSGRHGRRRGHHLLRRLAELHRVERVGRSAMAGSPRTISGSIDRVHSDEDIAAVTRLVWEFFDVLRGRYPDMVEEHDRYIAETDVAGELGNFRQVFMPPAGACFVARLADEPVGMVMLKSHGEGTGELNRMYVREAARGQGLGRALCTTLIDEARRLGLSPHRPRRALSPPRGSAALRVGGLPPRRRSAVFRQRRRTHRPHAARSRLTRSRRPRLARIVDDR